MKYNPFRYEPATIVGLALIALQWWGYEHQWTPERTMTVMGFATAMGAMLTRSNVISTATVHKAGMTVPELVADAADPKVQSVEQKAQAAAAVAEQPRAGGPQPLQPK